MTNASASSGQVVPSAAVVYEAELVPALFSEWTPRVAEAAHISPGQSVLDVACGTGALSREVARRVGPTGSVCGLDCNDGMLAVGRELAPHIEWKLGSAERLPFPADVFDAVVCQFGLMFFDDRKGALREMLRVARPGAGVVVAVWDEISGSEGYAAFRRSLSRLFGEIVAQSIDAPFCLGSLDRLYQLVDSVGAERVGMQTLTGMARFRSFDHWVQSNVDGWTLADVLDPAAVARLRNTLDAELAHLVQTDGTFCFGTRAHIVRLEVDP
jgi:SAM-dependent methyltransferase